MDGNMHEIPVPEDLNTIPPMPIVVENNEKAFPHDMSEQETARLKELIGEYDSFKNDPLDPRHDEWVSLQSKADGVKPSTIN